MLESEILELRRQARAGKSAGDARLVDLHRRAADELVNPERGAEVRNKALQQVARWERDHLCNPRYVKAWRGILNLPVVSVKAAILRDDAEGVSLRQNSPFGFLVKMKPK